MPLSPGKLLAGFLNRPPGGLHLLDLAQYRDDFFRRVLFLLHVGTSCTEGLGPTFYLDSFSASSSLGSPIHEALASIGNGRAAGKSTGNFVMLCR